MINIPTNVKQGLTLGNNGNLTSSQSMQNTEMYSNSGYNSNGGYNMQNVNTYNTNMQNTNMQNTNTYNTNMQNTNMQNINTYNTNMQNTNTQNQNMYNANAQTANAQTACTYTTNAGEQPFNANMNQNSFNNQSVQGTGYGMQNSRGQGVILSKGQGVSLSKINPYLDDVDVGLGWDVSTNAYDLDAEAFMVGQNGRVLGDEWFIFYNQPQSIDGAVRHSGDNKTGVGSGDDEVINIKLSKVNMQVQKIIFAVTISGARENNLSFAGVSNAFIRVVDKSSNRELVRFNLTDYAREASSMIVGELYRQNNEWHFNSIGNGTNEDLMALCMRFGVNVG